MASSSTIGADARLSELLQRLQEAEFLHVIGSAGVVGLVTPSDFNKQAARAYFYLLVSDLEIQVADWLRQSDHAEDDLIGRLPRRQRKRLESMLDKQKQADIAADAIAAMYFEDLLYLGDSTGLLEGLQSPFGEIGRSLLDEVNALRVDVMHLVKAMAVDRRESVTRLGGLQQHLQRMLREVEQASASTTTALP